MKTRGFLGLVALAAITLGTSCSNDELYNDHSPENAIGFSTYVGRDAQSRASVYDDTSLKASLDNGGGFGVFAYYTGTNGYQEAGEGVVGFKPNFMYNEDIVFNSTSSKWEYNPVKYWPNSAEEKISFFAYAPFTESSSGSNITGFSANNEAGAPIVTYKVAQNVKDQKEILWGVQKTSGKPNLDVQKQGMGQDVSFNFRHALARIGFNVEAMIDAVNSVSTPKEDNGATTNGTIDHDILNIYVRKVELKGNFYSQGQLNLNNTTQNVANWEPQSLPTSTTTFVLEDGIVDGQPDGETSEVCHFNDIHGVVTTEKQPLNAADSYIMVIPQKFEGPDKIKIIVYYDVIVKDEKVETGEVTIPNVVDSGDFNFEFNDGKAYSFNLHIGLTSITFSADVTDWVTGNTTSGTDGFVVNVPIVANASANN